MCPPFFFLECCDLAPALCIPAVLTTAPRQLPNFPTSRKANKPKSWQVGKLANWQAPTPCTTTPSLSFTPHPTLPTPCTRARCILPLCTPPVTVTAQCSHCTLLSLHLAITSSGLPANFPTLQVSDFPTSRKVGKSESWQVPPPYNAGEPPRIVVNSSHPARSPSYPCR